MLFWSAASGPDGFSSKYARLLLQSQSNFHDRADRRHELASELGERVFDRRRRCPHDAARDDAFALELAQSGAEHFRRDGRDVPAKLTEASIVCAQVPH